MNKYLVVTDKMWRLQPPPSSRVTSPPPSQDQQHGAVEMAGRGGVSVQGLHRDPGPEPRGGTGTGTQPRQNTDNAKQLFEITTSATASDPNYYRDHASYHNEHVRKEG